MLTFRQILNKAWQITWQNPGLWFFGLFVALLGSAGEIEIFLRAATLKIEPGILTAFFSGLVEGGFFSLAGLKGLLIALVSQPLSLFIVLLLLMIIFGLTIFIIWLIIVSQGALINGAIHIIKNKKLSWSENFYFGISKFWSILTLNILAKVIFWLLFIVLGVFAALKFPDLVFLFIIVFILFISVLVIISFIIKYAICGVVLKNWQFSDALKLALKLFYKNWLLSLEIAIILFLIYLIINSLLIFFISLIFLYALRLFSVFFTAILLVLLTLVIIFIVVQIFLAVFHWTTWVLVFEILTNKKIIFISRLVNGWKKIFS